MAKTYKALGSAVTFEHEFAQRSKLFVLRGPVRMAPD